MKESIPLQSTEREQWLPILAYHRVVDVVPAADTYYVCISRKDFERQMRWFSRLGYTTIALEEAARLIERGERIPPRRFVITFDDGYEDTLTIAHPIMRVFGFTATIFAVSGKVGETSSWDDSILESVPLMTWDQLRECICLGHTIGSHTVSHPHLAEIPPDVAARELIDSRRILEEQLGAPVRSFCYPYGNLSEQVQQLVADAGYEAAVVNAGRWPHQRYTLARIRCPSNAPALFTPLVRCRPWYYASSQTDALNRLRGVAQNSRRRLAAGIAAVHRVGLSDLYRQLVAIAHHHHL